MAVAQQIEVRTPDGTIVTFPEGTSPETIQRVMIEGYSPESPTAALARYRETHPNDQGATVVAHGDANYPGSYSKLDSASNTYVADTDAERLARDEARRLMAEQKGPITDQVRAISSGMSFGLSDELESELVAANQRGENLNARLMGGEMPFTSEQLKTVYMDELAKARDEFSSAHGLQSFGFELLGGIAAPGVAQAGRFVAGANSGRQAALRGLMTSTPAGSAYGFGNADSGERGQGAVSGGVTAAIIGAGLPPAARMVGGAAGVMGGNAMRDTVSDYGSMLMGRPMTDEGRAVRTLMRGVDPAEAASRMTQGQRYGADLTLADIGGSNVQSRVRVAATRQTPGRELAQDFADGRRTDMQDYVSNLAERISPIDATPDEISGVLRQFQSAASRPAYDQARAGPPIRIDNNLAQALWGAEGRRAVAKAARAYSSSTNPEDRAIAQELQALSARMNNRTESTAAGAANDQGIELSVGAADLLSRYLNKAGGQDLNLQRIFGGLGRQIREQARAQSSDYGAALDGYAARSRLGDGAELGNRFVGRGGRSRDYEREVGAMRTRSAAQPSQPGQSIVPAGQAPDGPTLGGRGVTEIEVARVAARNALENAGETPGGAAGALDALAVGRGQNRRSIALLGPEGAADLREGAMVGRRMVETGRNVNPRAGSNTFLNSQDGEAKAVGGIIANIIRLRPLEAAGGIWDMLRSQGISDEQAELIVEMALNPDRTAEAMQILTTQLGPLQSRRLIEGLTPNVSGQIAGAQVRTAEANP